MVSSNIDLNALCAGYAFAIYGFTFVFFVFILTYKACFAIKSHCVIGWRLSIEHRRLKLKTCKATMIAAAEEQGGFSVIAHIRDIVLYARLSLLPPQVAGGQEEEKREESGFHGVCHFAVCHQI